MRKSRVWQWFCVLSVASAVGCSSCGEPENNGKGQDVGGETVDAGPDIEPAMEVGVPDADPTADEGTPDLGMPDMPPADTDEDGVVDGDDNCPEMANADQADRDRDGVGDVCDRLPFIHDPSNPQTVDTVMEDEDEIPNDNAAAGLEYGLALPFVVQGVVGAVEDGNPDLDFYTFRIDEPTAVLVNLVANQSVWGGAILIGSQWPTANEWRVHIAPQVGASEAREMWLAYPGEYTIAVSDARNFIESQADVGGPGFDYRLSVSALPLPEAQPITLPESGVTTEHDGVLKVYEADVSGAEGIRAVARGMGGDQNSFVSPILAFYDPNDARTLAMNSLGQVANNETELAVKFSGREKLTVIADWSQAFGASSTMTVGVGTANLAAETETVQMQADNRLQDVPWVTYGETVSAQIDEPRGTVGDQDPFLFSVKRGEIVRVKVAPLANSDLQPFVQFGHLVEQAGDSFFIPLHEAPDGEAGAETTVEYLVAAWEDGEVAAMVMHAPNYFSSDPDGGPRYGYRFSVESVAAMPKSIATVPGQTDLAIADGSFGLVEFPASAGDFLSVREESALFTDMRIIDPTTFEVLATGDSSATFGAPADGSYWMEMHDLIGRGTDVDPASVSVEPLTVTPLGALPAKADGVLDPQPSQLYSFDGSAGDVIDIRVATEAFFPAIRLLDAGLQPVGFTSYARKHVVLESDGQYIVQVEASSGNPSPDYDYTLGVQKIAPTPIALGGAPATGTLDDEPFGQWYSVPVTTGGVYSATTLDEFGGRIGVYDPKSGGTIRSSTNGTVRWVSTYDGEAWLSLYENDNLGDPAFEFVFSARQIVAVDIFDGQPVEGELTTATEQDVYNLTANPGMVEIEVEPVGDWSPRIDLLSRDNYGGITEARQVGNIVRYAQSSPGEQWAVAVSQSDATAVGPLTYTITFRLVGPGGAIQEVEPNDAVAQAQPVSGTPIVIAGTGTTADPGDRYSVSLRKWQRITALATDRNSNGTDRFNAAVQLQDASGTSLASNSYGGEGFMPAFHGFQAPTSGTYLVFYGPRTGQTTEGDYYLYLATSPVTAVAESEPNETTALAADVGALGALTAVAATVDGGDAVDVVGFEVTSAGRLRVGLDGAADGYVLRLFDAGGALLAESGSTTADAAAQPRIDVASISAGSYFAEVSLGTAAGGSFDLLLLAE